MKNWPKLTALLFLFPLLSFAQESKLGNWMIVFGNKSFDKGYFWHHEVQYRNYDAIGDLEQLLLRTGIGKNISDNANALLGYGFIRSENYVNDNDKIVINEHRIYQQLISKQNIGKLRMQHRYRFEQRWVESDFRLRFRYFLGMNYPIWKKTDAPNEIYLSAYDELFINTKATVFDRNRLYGGIGYRLNKMLRFELGYMNQFFTIGGRDQVNLVCFINY